MSQRGIGDLGALTCALALAFASAEPARAQPPAAPEEPSARCARRYEDAQVDLAAGRLQAALASATACAQAECPAVARALCTEHADLVLTKLPTLVVRARGEDGCDLPRGRVLVDGAHAPRALDGRPVRVDPGERVVRVELEGRAPMERRIVAAQGEKDRRVDFVLGDPSAACGVAAAPPAAHSPPPSGDADAPTRMNVPAIVVGSIGLAALATGAGFWIAGFVERDQLEACKPCSEDEIGRVRTLFIAGDATGFTGVGALGVALVLFLVLPSDAKAPRASHWLVPVPLTGGAGAVATVPF